MKVATVRVQGYRCLEAVTIALGPLTALIGANGTGKSSILHALEWFFEGGALDTEDVCGLDPSGSVTVAVTFDELGTADRSILAGFGLAEKATFTRSWSAEDGERVQGVAQVYPPFEEVRSVDGASELRRVYNQLRSADPSLELPAVSAAASARDEMFNWERAHPTALVASSSAATQLFAASGDRRLRDRFEYILVPAVADATAQMGANKGGTLLSRLIEIAALDDEAISESLEEIRTRAVSELDELLVAQHEPSLMELGTRVTMKLQEFFSGGAISLDVERPEISLPRPNIRMRVSHDGLLTSVDRQGHGVQRALLIATIQELASIEAHENRAAFLLAIEEPELYQHPTQARMFCKALSKLSHKAPDVNQVLFATHSPYFVDGARYEQLRRFSKVLSGSIATTKVACATVEGIAARLVDIVPAEEVPRRVALTIGRKLQEAVFASAVLLVEGTSDQSILQSVADRSQSLDASGVAIVAVGSKTLLPLAMAVLEELEIPVMAVFDSDADLEERLRAKGLPEPEIESAVSESIRWNRTILRMSGAVERDWPPSGIQGRSASIATNFRDFHRSEWPELTIHAQILSEAAGEGRSMSRDWEAAAAMDVEAAPPSLFVDIVSSVRRLSELAAQVHRPERPE